MPMNVMRERPMLFSRILAPVMSHVVFHRHINPSDCVDMDCDAKKKCVIKDIDCSLLGGKGKCTILPEAEYEWDGDPARGVGDYRIPKTFLTDSQGNRLKVADVCPNKGV
jgi:hypothetical protein